ncbi:hypothetical protein MTO96_029025 [Rhipicephalus appendiculatus]
MPTVTPSGVQHNKQEIQNMNFHIVEHEYLDLESMNMASLTSMPLFKTWNTGDKTSSRCLNSVKEARTLPPIILIGDIGEGTAATSGSTV